MKLLAVTNPVDNAGRIVAHIHGAIRTDDDARGTPHVRAVFPGAGFDPAGDEVLGAAFGFAVLTDFNPHYAVAAQHAAIPRAMKNHEVVALIFLREHGTCVEGGSEGRGMGLGLHDGGDCRWAPLLRLGFVFGVRNTAAITVRPAEIAAIFPQVVDFLGWEIVP